MIFRSVFLKQFAKSSSDFQQALDIMGAFTVRNATEEDAAAIADIYNHYVLHTVVTFEEETVPVESMVDRIQQVRADYPWLVAVEDEQVLGYAYANAWHVRPAYRHSVESSVYLDSRACGRGIGTLLYKTSSRASARQISHRHRRCCAPQCGERCTARKVWISIGCNVPPSWPKSGKMD